MKYSNRTKKSEALDNYWGLFLLLNKAVISIVERLRLRLQICLNLTPVSIYLNFGLIVYYVETQVQQPK